MTDRVSADFLILGSGIAGLRAAVALAPFGRVLVLTKSGLSAGSTAYAQGGIASALGPDDSPALHAADTHAAGDGLCDERAVAVMTEEGPKYVRELIAWGAVFDRQADGALALAREGGHSVRRVLHARDATGREIARAITGRLREMTSVTVVDHALAVGLIVEGGRVVGARFLDSSRSASIASIASIREARASATLVATGGAGQVYRDTTNPSVATGDGVTLGYLAGARVADLEFVQFHPTVLDVAGAPRSLLSEALRGEGGRLVNEAGEAFMARYEPAAELAPRDRVARAILRERARTNGPVYLTMSHLSPDEVHTRFPHVADLCRAAGLDLATDRIPVGPAAHYMMGGLVTDLDGRTSLPGLFAAGEVACTGVHGANRLASNSLLEGLVFGARAAHAMTKMTKAAETTKTTKTQTTTRPKGDDWPAFPPEAAPLPLGGGHGAPIHVPMSLPDVQALMWADAAVFRDHRGLSRALAALEPPWDAIRDGLANGGAIATGDWPAVTVIVVARLIVRAALRREESRGAHARTDFPERDDLHWTRHVSENREAL